MKPSIVSLVSLFLLSMLVAPVRAAMLAPGDLVPAWQLTDQNGVQVDSGSLAGRPYVLWFYPRAQTPGCTLEGRGLRDRAPAFDALGVDILGVSFDTPEANARFVAAESFPFRLLSDESRTVALALGAATDAAQAAARRIS